MDEADGFMNGEVEEGICTIADSYFETFGIENYAEDDMVIEAFSQADSGYIYLVKFRDKTIGCVLYFNREVTVSRYFNGSTAVDLN